ncbi:alpha/beta hydrolase, partial [Modestobacter versicolor]
MTDLSASPARLEWPAGATSHVTDLDGPVRHLDLGGPAGAPVVAVHGLGGS